MRHCVLSEHALDANKGRPSKLRYILICKDNHNIKNITRCAPSTDVAIIIIIYFKYNTSIIVSNTENIHTNC